MFQLEEGQLMWKQIIARYCKQKKKKLFISNSAVQKGLQKETIFELALEGLARTDQIQQKNCFLYGVVSMKWPKRALHIKEAQKHLKHSVDGKESDRK